MNKLEFIVNNTRTDKQMVLRFLKPANEVTHKHRHPICRRGQMNQALIAEGEPVCNPADFAARLERFVMKGFA